ncbi:MAG TPA: type II secretion system F family protein [Streptosporangiaceae bacterium]|nr:type II secretion system F family protein [Streptosporangiaceae bacterium]
MNLIVIISGTLIGIGLFVVVSQIMPAGPRLDAALARIGGTTPGVDLDLMSMRTLGRQVGALPWLPVPVTDLALLGQDAEQWMTSKIVCGVVGLAFIPFLEAVLFATGHRESLVLPAIASLALGVALFFAPDLVVRTNAAEKRLDFKHALTSYLDLVALERGAGAAPTEALEAAAQIGGGWAFARIAAALDAARKAGRPPWEGLADLAAATGVSELTDLAEIAEVAGHEGARILQTLTARAESMRAEALAATKAKAGSRSTTMVVPIALLGAGFLLLIVFPIVYRAFR